MAKENVRFPSAFRAKIAKAPSSAYGVVRLAIASATLKLKSLQEQSTLRWRSRPPGSQPLQLRRDLRLKYKESSRR